MTDSGLRRAEAADLPGIKAVVDAAYVKYVERIGRPPAPMVADYAALLESSRIWVIDCDATVVGMLVTRDRGDHLLLDSIAVAPGTQGSGYGAQLMARAELDAVEQGLCEVRLYTNEAMTENLSFYPRQGYRETHRATEDGYRRVFYAKSVGLPSDRS
jgi:N-acetylglutamate synthase-like GNAT family acetyltransferase